MFAAKYPKVTETSSLLKNIYYMTNNEVKSEFSFVFIILKTFLTISINTASRGKCFSSLRHLKIKNV